METIYVDIENQTVTINGETCNFYEAGLHNNEDENFQLLTDPDTIEEHLIEREGEEAEIVFTD